MKPKNRIRAQFGILSIAEDQNALTWPVLDKRRSERDWGKSFAGSEDILGKPALEAGSDYRANIVNRTNV
jgi:hypothetical protein